MTKNTIETLRTHLFEVMEKIKNGDMDVKEAKAMVETAQTIINSAKVEIDFIKAVGSDGIGTGFIPLEPLSGEPRKIIPEIIPEMCNCKSIDPATIHKNKKDKIYYHIVCGKQYTKQ